MQQLVIDSNGKVPIPPDVMRKYGLAPGSKVTFDDRDDKIIIEPLRPPSNGAEKSRKRRSMHDMVGFLGKDPKSLNTLMEERRRDREKEDRPFGS